MPYGLRAYADNATTPFFLNHKPAWLHSYRAHRPVNSADSDQNKSVPCTIFAVHPPAVLLTMPDMIGQ